MIIVIETSVGFILPDEYELMQQFKEEHDMREWKESESTGLISFSQKKYFSREINHDELKTEGQ